jgi:hypothetical protein
MCVRLNSNYNLLQTNVIKSTSNLTKNLTQDKPEVKQVNQKIKDQNNIDSSSKITSKPISFVDKQTLVNVAKIVPPTIASISTSKASASVVKVATETIVKASSKAITKTSVERILSSTSSLVAKPVIKAAISSTTQTAGVVAAEVIATKVLQKSAQKAAQKGAEKTASRLSSMVPVAGAAIGIAITAYDAKYAYELSKDPKASKFSKAMAWTTVGLDSVATATTATGVGSAIGWVATGLSIGTSVLAEVYR